MEYTSAARNHLHGMKVQDLQQNRHMGTEAIHPGWNPPPKGKLHINVDPCSNSYLRSS